MKIISTVVGNYPKTPDAPKPQKLRSALHRFDQGEITKEELGRIEAEVTKDVIDEQVKAGIELVTDGQIRWDDAQTYFAQKIKGFSINGLLRYFDSNMYYRQPVVEEDLKWQEPILSEDYQFAKGVSATPVKPVITGPLTLAKLSLNKHYPDFKTFVLRLAEILNQEALELQKENPPLIQFDEPVLVRNKDDFLIFKKAADILTAGLKVETALYTYFGDIVGLYPDILSLPFDTLGLDLVQGEKNWEILKNGSFNKNLGFGIVDARNTKLEKVEDLVAKIKGVSENFKAETIYVNPSCGLEFLPRGIAFKKLKILAEAVTKLKQKLSF